MAGCQTDFDGFITGECVAPPVDVDSEENIRGDFAGYHSVDYNYKSTRMDKQNFDRVADFIDTEDALPLRLLYNLQKKTPWESFAQYRLTRIVLSDEALVYMTADGATAVILLVGQNIATNSQHLVDDLNIAGATANQACQLRLARVGMELIDKVKSYGTKEIILCGYSLGGAAVACICDKATRGIIFNGGAPPSNSPRPVPDNCKVYHIVGDLLSTHYMKAKRIYLVETLTPREQDDTHLQTDGIQWYDIGYYHDMDRFMDHGGPYRIVSPQFEQNSLENYFFFKMGEGSDVLGAIAGIVSVNFNFRRKIQLQICSNPVPGSYPSRGCKEGGPTVFDKAAGALLGGFLGGAISAIPTGGAGALAGASAGAAAGLSLASGEKGVLDLINPDFGKAAVDLGEAVVSGASQLDAFNNKKGGFTSKIRYDNPKPQMDRLVVKVK